MPQDFNLSDNSYPSHYSVNIDEIAMDPVWFFSFMPKRTRRDVGYRLRCESKFGYASKVRWRSCLGIMSAVFRCKLALRFFDRKWLMV